jgi:alpha-glucosidase
VGTHADAHNIFNFRWIRGIYKGYLSHDVQRRPFMMSRSGTAGIQRFGAAMWSGDIASRLTSLAAHAGNQMHMSFSGIDFFGADIGGFHRNLEGDQKEMYTQWYGYGMMFDIPGRPHTENLCNCKETAPDRIGDLPSNLENARLRYKLIPYLYSLAHRAYNFGEPLMPAPIMYYQTDNNLRNVGREKMIGPYLLAAVIARHGQSDSDVYLPSGTWIDWHTHNRSKSPQSGSTVNVPAYRDNLFKVPLFAKEGAIIPMMFVDENTMNAFGKRRDGTVRNELIAKVFAFDGDDNDGTGSSNFTLYEDDGVTTEYLIGRVRTTDISQLKMGKDVKVTVDQSIGSYNGAPVTRDNVVKLVADNVGAKVILNGSELQKFSTTDELKTADSGWVNDTGNKTIIAKSGVKNVSEVKTFVFTLVEGPIPIPIPKCKSTFSAIYVTGAGNGWNPADPARKLTCVQGKIWTGKITMSNEQYKFTANGSWAVNWGSDGKQNGPNFPAIAANKYNVTFNEDDATHPTFEPVVDGVVDGEKVSAKLICENGHTTSGTSVYVLGNIAELGSWKSDNAVKLEPNGPYPTWTGVIKNLPGNTKVEWKCIKRLEGGDLRVIQWESGDNNVFTTPASGAAPDQRGSF